MRDVTPSDVTPLGAQGKLAPAGEARLSPDHGRGSLVARVRAFAVPDRKRSIRQLSVTAGGFVALWVAMLVSTKLPYWVTLLLAVPAAGLVVRFFMIQHDCGHAAFFKSRRMNDLFGHLIGMITLTPYTYWRGTHAEHHATSGNLDRRGVGDVTTLTVREYLALSWWGRFGYRFYRHPLVLFGLGPIYLFVVKFRLPLDLPLRKTGAWLSVLATNAAIAGCLLGLALLIGPINLLKMQLPITLVASAVGVWMFFIQHQFEGVYWRRQDAWQADRAALEGSSYYRLPKILQWFTASIGLHHIHHLCSRIPNYRLQECLDRVPELKQGPHMTFTDSLRCATLALWDEAASKLIRFRDLKGARYQNHD
jgi:omega-6 fatty acid desaturase (delta-12 desaturase)